MPPNRSGAGRPPTNYRKTRRNQERMLMILVLLVLVVGGSGLIGLIWGLRQALLGGVCLLGGAALIGGLWLLLSVAQRWLEE